MIRIDDTLRKKVARLREFHNTMKAGTMPAKAGYGAPGQADWEALADAWLAVVDRLAKPGGRSPESRLPFEEAGQIYKQGDVWRPCRNVAVACYPDMDATRPWTVSYCHQVAHHAFSLPEAARYVRSMFGKTRLSPLWDCSPKNESRSRPWPPEDLEVMCKFYDTKPSSWLAAKLKWPREQIDIREMGKRLGLRKTLVGPKGPK